MLHARNQIISPTPNHIIGFQILFFVPKFCKWKEITKELNLIHGCRGRFELLKLFLGETSFICWFPKLSLLLLVDPLWRFLFMGDSLSSFQLLSFCELCYFLALSWDSLKWTCFGWFITYLGYSRELLLYVMNVWPSFLRWSSFDVLGGQLFLGASQFSW